MAVWRNDDGLLVRFGTTEAEDTAIGEFGDFDPGNTHPIQLELNPTTLGGVLTEVTHYGAKLPGYNGSTCFIKRAEIFVETAFDSAGEAATLTIGLNNEDGTVFDADGIDVTIAEGSIDAVADTIVCDGAKVAVRLDNTQALYVTTTVGTEVFTAGKGWLRIWYYLVNE